MRKIIFIGGTAISAIVMEILKANGAASEYGYAGFIDDNEELKGKSIFGLSVLGTFRELPDIISKHQITDAVICIPENYMQTRKKYFAACREMGLNMLCAVHPSAVIASDAHYADGVIIMAGVAVNTGVRIGNNVIIFSNAVIEHNCTLEDHVYISPGVLLGGHVTVKERAMLGIGSIIMPQRTIGSNATVGAGSVVTRDITEDTVVVGVPARERAR